MQLTLSHNFSTNLQPQKSRSYSVLHIQTLSGIGPSSITSQNTVQIQVWLRTRGTSQKTKLILSSIAQVHWIIYSNVACKLAWAVVQIVCIWEAFKWAWGELGEQSWANYSWSEDFRFGRKWGAASLCLQPQRQGWRCDRWPCVPRLYVPQFARPLSLWRLTREVSTTK